jgi:cyclophilin family peptidyl-prolyl cis-trans isomerase/HEAT repeat protein
MSASRWLATAAVIVLSTGARAQPGAIPSARVEILLAEDRRAPTPRDLATIRTGIRSRDPQTARLAIRAVGRLEQPALISDLLPALGFDLPEIRAEAANAIGQAAQGWNVSVRRRPAPGALTPTSVLASLVERLADEAEGSVRAAICDTIGRLPYRDRDQVSRAESALVDLAEASTAVNDRLGVAKGLEALVRNAREMGPPGRRAIDALRTLSGVPVPPSIDTQQGTTTRSTLRGRSEHDPLRDARVRRLALEALITVKATEDDVVRRAATDPDPQVRRLAMRAAAISGRGTSSLTAGLTDTAAMVRFEALRGLRARADQEACPASLAASSDVDQHVALLALDQLGECGSSQAAVEVLQAAVTDMPWTASGRGWHRAAHAIVALASADRDAAIAALGQFLGSPIWQLRMYAARAAASLEFRGVLEKLAVDSDDNVVEAAIGGLSKLTGHEHDSTYIAALSRTGYQAIRAAALALDATPHTEAAVPALRTTLQRLIDEGRANSADTRAAVAATLARLGSPPAPAKSEREAAVSTSLNADDLRRLAAPRARVTMAGLGIFELVLFTSEAPATVLRFAQLAESGYYNGLTFHRVVPNFVIQGGSPAANEYVGDAAHMRDEVGLWPHVRGAVGVSTRGRDTGDAQFFIDLVDNPRFDHEYTVFAQVLNGLDVVDRILEGDVIERVEIIP